MSEQHATHLARRATEQRRIDVLFDRFEVMLAPSATGDPLFRRGWTLLGRPCVHPPFARGSHGLLANAQLAHERLLR